MKKRTFSVFALTLVFVLSVFAAPPKRPAFDAQAAWTYIRDLSSDVMMGRKSGHPGGLMGAEYVAAKFKEWGLEPAGTKGYFQAFTLDYSYVEPGATLQVITPRKKRGFVYADDWRAQRFSGSATFMAEIVYVGYGISAPQKDFDEYSGVDVKGKWVLFATDTPQQFRDKIKEEVQLQTRVKAAQDHGARGVMTFQSGSPFGGMGMPAAAAGGARIGVLTKDIYKPDFVILTLNDTKIVNMVFKDLKTELRFHTQQIEETGKPQSFATGVQAMVRVKAEYDEKRATENVLAKIVGSDPKLRSEYVILGGHMDHLGFDSEGDIDHGANDNASGTAVAMEIARAMKAAGVKPRRTVVFAAWAGEEAGLLGSKYYSENPVFPIERTVAYLNMDMVGHGNGKVGFPGTYYGPEIWDLLKSKLPKEMLADVVPSRGGPGGSDQSYFLYMGVPAFATMTEGYHFKYHQSGDTIDLIKKDVLQKVGDFIMASAGVLADEPKNLIQPLRRETFWWKYSTVVNYTALPVDEIVAKYGNVTDPEVDMQLAALPDAGASGEARRVALVNALFGLSDRFKDAKSLVLYGAPQTGGMTMMRGGPSKTTVIPGLVGPAAIQDDPRWLDVLGKQGVNFLALDKPAFLFGGNGLSEEGKKFIENLNKTSVLLFVKDLDASQAKALLEASKRPFILLEGNLPPKEVLDLIRQKSAALGVVCGPADDAAVYVKKLDEVKKAIGTDSLIMVIGQNLWDKAGKDQALRILTELFKMKFENDDFRNIFAGTLNRLIASLTTQGSSAYSMFMMY